MVSIQTSLGEVRHVVPYLSGDGRRRYQCDAKSLGLKISEK